jgi:hypothetical protein
MIAPSSTTSNGDRDDWRGGPSGFCTIRNGGVVSVERVQDMCRVPRGNPGQLPDDRGPALHTPISAMQR